jgi:hypothetical protein
VLCHTGVTIWPGFLCHTSGDMSVVLVEAEEAWRAACAAARARKRATRAPRLRPFVCVVCGHEGTQLGRGRRRRTCPDGCECGQRWCRKALERRRKARQGLSARGRPLKLLADQVEQVQQNWAAEDRAREAARPGPYLSLAEAEAWLRS